MDKQREKFNVWFNKYNFAGRAWNECMFDAWQAASQERAPVALPVKRWQDRLPLCPSKEQLMASMDAEIADLRAALAARPVAPLLGEPSDTTLIDFLQTEMADVIYLDDGRVIDVGGKHGGNVRAAIAAMSQQKEPS